MVFSLGNLVFDGGGNNPEFNTGWLVEVALSAAGEIVSVTTQDTPVSGN